MIRARSSAWLLARLLVTRLGDLPARVSPARVPPARIGSPSFVDSPVGFPVGSPPFPGTSFASSYDRMRACLPAHSCILSMGILSMGRIFPSQQDARAALQNRPAKRTRTGLRPNIRQKPLCRNGFQDGHPSAYATPGTRAIAVAKPTRSNRQIPALLALPLTGPTPIPIQCDAETGGQRRTSCPLYFAENTPYISWESAFPRKSHSHLSERFNSRRKMGKSDAMHAPRSNASAVRSPHIAQIFSLQMARSAQFATQRARTGYRPDTDWADQDDYCSNWADPVIQRPKTSSK